MGSELEATLVNYSGAQKVVEWCIARTISDLCISFVFLGKKEENLQTVVSFQGVGGGGEGCSTLFFHSTQSPKLILRKRIGK